MLRSIMPLPSLKALTAVIVWGGSFVATKAALEELDPYTLIWLRFALGAAILLAVEVSRRRFAVPPLKDLGLFALLAIQGVTLHQWLQCVALQTAKASTSGWIIATSALFMALLGWMFLGEKISRIQFGGMILSVGGLLLVLSDGDPARLFQGEFGSFGDLLMLISALNWALFSVFSRGLLRRCASGTMMLYVMFFGWLFSSIFFGRSINPGLIPHISTSTTAAVLALGIVCTGLAYTFWYDALEAMEASKVGAFMYIEPPAAVLIAFFFLGEPLLPLALLGGSMILGGVWLVNRT